MVQVGSLFTCDRCGRTYFHENEGTYSIPANHDVGWGERMGKDLCPECLEKFDYEVRLFFGPNLEVVEG